MLANGSKRQQLKVAHATKGDAGMNGKQRLNLGNGGRDTLDEDFEKY